MTGAPTGAFIRSRRRVPVVILTAIAEEPRHGYAVMQAVERLSDGRVTLRAGTLYAALDRLTAEGLLEVDHEEAVEGRLRRYYRLTGPGRELLAAESGAWLEFHRTVRTMLAPGGTTP